MSFEAGIGELEILRSRLRRSELALAEETAKAEFINVRIGAAQDEAENNEGKAAEAERMTVTTREKARIVEESSETKQGTLR
jgi:hypothetical protein